jgi:DNA-binding transcriptional MerR regulator
MTEFLSTNDVAKILKKSQDPIRHYERTGKLNAIRTQGGIRLFSREQVEHLAREQNRNKEAEI